MINIMSKRIIKRNGWLRRSLSVFGTKHSEQSKQSPSNVSVHNEWDPLEEVIVGTPLFASYPGRGDKYFEKSFGDGETNAQPPLPCKFSPQLIEETVEDIDKFVNDLRKLGIIVKRPEPIEFHGKIKTFDWESEHYFCYCPRDLHLAIGNTIIECPSGFRTRYLETFSYHKIMYDYLKNGSRWISAPKGRLDDSCFNYERKPGQSILTEKEMIFDAANVLRLGRDILYLVSDSGNELGCHWLQSTLGNQYKVHPCRNMYSGIHIDTTLVVLRPGLILLNPTVNIESLPAILRKWDIIYAPEMNEVHYEAARNYPYSASKWLGMNLLMLSPTLAAVDSNQTALIKLLESHKIDVLPVLLRHGRVLGGGPHCITLDTRRTGSLESYF